MFAQQIAVELFLRLERLLPKTQFKNEAYLMDEARYIPWRCGLMLIDINPFIKANWV